VDDPAVSFAADEAGIPDGFQRLWTPHRMVYIGGESRPLDSTEAECPFCRSPKRSDADGLVVYRGSSVYVIMNLYPYNPGHVLVCPYRHISDYTDLTTDERVEFGEVTGKAMEVLRAVSRPAGFNVGMNQGAVAGAGIAGHLHQHVVPRWLGDSNFLPVIGQTKALPQLLGDTRTLLAEEWSR
jgi:ATP adenylyltransferase